MSKFNGSKKEIEVVREKMNKYEPNSIMGVHYSSKLAGLERELRNTKDVEFEIWYEGEFGGLSLNKDLDGNYVTKRARSCLLVWNHKQKEIDRLIKHINEALDGFEAMNLIKEKVNEELISGREALIALANGENVEYLDENLNEWVCMDMAHHFKRKFRLKPAILINSIEVPAPFEPKEYEDCYVLTGLYEHGYTRTSWKYSKSVPAWRTEAEIKQVVVALQNVFKGEVK